jgi:hypothetical protein
MFKSWILLLLKLIIVSTAVELILSSSFCVNVLTRDKECPKTLGAAQRLSDGMRKKLNQKIPGSLQQPMQFLAQNRYFKNVQNFSAECIFMKWTPACARIR